MKFISMLILILILCFNILTFADDEWASISPIGQESIYSDFADIEVTLTAAAHYHYSLDVTVKLYWHNGTTYVELYADDYYHDWIFQYGEYYWSITNETYQIKNIAYKRNGDFKFYFGVNAGAMASRYITFEVVDTQAPPAPTLNDIYEPYLGHPQLSWNKPSIDTEKYNVYRTGTDYDGGGWNHIATPTTTSFEDEDVICGIPDATVSYKIKAVDYEDNISAYSNTESIVAHFKPVVPFSPISDEVPKSFNLSQNYPNPFNPETNITFDLPEDCFTTLVIYNINGEKVATLVNEQLPAGSYTARINGSVLPSGVYIYKMQAGSFSQIKRMLLIK